MDYLESGNGSHLVLGSEEAKEMEAAGWSVRKRDPHDRRRHLVEITESGKTAVDHAEKARERLEEEILRELSPEERATLIRLMRRALDGLLRATPEPAKL